MGAAAIDSEFEFWGWEVSNPISGEVGAAAYDTTYSVAMTECFKPHQRGGGCCSLEAISTIYDADA